MDAAVILRRVRQHAGLTLRELAVRARTSHSTLAAYESGRVTPTVSTFDRIIGAAGLTVDAAVRTKPYLGTTEARGRELAEVLDLAGGFPARHAATLEFPVFPGRT